MEPISHNFLIQNPSVSNKSISLHTLIYKAHDIDPPSSVRAPPTIIFLHYWGGSASTFSDIPPLLPAVWRDKLRAIHPTMISVSFRGWGLSSRAVPDVPQAYSVRPFAEDILALLDHFQTEQLLPPASDGMGEFVLCGHSMGGKVALEVAALLSDASSNNFPKPHLRGLLLLAPAPPGPLIVPNEVRMQMKQAYDSAEGVRWTARNVLTASGEGSDSSGAKTADPSYMEKIVRDSLAGSDGAKRGWLEVMMSEDTRDRLKDGRMIGKGVKVRVMVALGDRVETVERVEVDTVAFLRSEAIFGKDNVKYHVVKPTDTPDGANVGHLLPLEAPYQVALELFGLFEDIVQPSATEESISVP
jgi:pimeloyl-ACP methyl ester carboxylesterase